jgi:hypothetical protein
MQTLAAKEEGRYREIAISVQLTAHVVALRQVLHALETHTPYLFIENLMVRTQVPGNFKPGPGNEPEMYVSMEVHGFSLTGTP